MTPFTYALAAALLHFVWQGLLVGFLLWIALAIFARGPARLRYLISCGALATMTALPAITTWLLYRAPAAWAPVSGRPVDVFPPAGAAALPSGAWFSTIIAMIEAWAVPVWFAGVLIFAIRLIFLSRHAGRLRRDGRSAEVALLDSVARLAARMGVTRPVKVLISHLAETPSVVGWLRPVILIPAATLLSLSVEQLETVLAHELAHIRRHDYLVNILQTLSETLFFYHPAVWWVSGRIRHERELCCDDMVVEISGDAAGYARALAKLERLRVAAPELAMSSAGGALLFRIRRLAGASDERPASKVPPLVALSLAVLCLAFNLQRAGAQPQTGEESAVRLDTIWTDTVKFGNLPVEIRALGRIVASGTVELKVAEQIVGEAKLGQTATVDARHGVLLTGTVSRIDPFVSNGTVTVAVQLQAAVPEFIGTEVDGTIRIKTLKDVIYVGRPVVGKPNTWVTLFRLDPDGAHAQRVKVRLGAASVNTIQVLEGLQPGDHVIISDMSKYDDTSRIRLE